MTADEIVPAAAREPGCGGTILVLEDDRLIRDVLRRTLEQWGFEVEVVDEGRKAVARALERFHAGAPFDLLVLDLTIPGGMGGRQALAEILRVDPDASAIVASGYSDDPVLANHLEAGFAAALAKPFKREELAHAVATVLRAPADRKGREQRAGLIRS